MSSGSPSVDNQFEQGGRSRTTVGTKPRSSSRASEESRSTKGSSLLRAPTPPAPVQSSDSRAPSVQSTTRSSDSPTAYTPDSSEDTPTMPGQESVIADELADPPRAEPGGEPPKPARERSRSAAVSSRGDSSNPTARSRSKSSDRNSGTGRGRPLRRTMREETGSQPTGAIKQESTDIADSGTLSKDKPTDKKRQVSRSGSSSMSNDAEGRSQSIGAAGGGTLEQLRRDGAKRRERRERSRPGMSARMEAKQSTAKPA